MAQLHSQKLTNLLLQAPYAPEPKRLGQLDACESLLRLIQKDKSYPYDFVCYHLTGYRSRNTELDSQELISFSQLTHDLPLYCEKLSRSMRIGNETVKGKYYTAASLAKHFRVSEKTISRWRKMGLAGRYLVYPDGRLRLGFNEKTVDYFVRLNHTRVEKSGNFTLIGPSERQMIENRLRKWACRCPDQRQEALERTAKRYGRCLETVRSILCELETLPASPARFFKRAAALTDETGEAIYRAFQDGSVVDELVRQFGRSRANIYRVINLCKSRELIHHPIEYIPSPEFELADTRFILEPETGLFDTPPARLEAPAKTEASPLTFDSLGAYINDIYGNKVLGARQEFFLFRKMNFLKYLADKQRQSVQADQPSGRSLTRIRLYLQQAQDIQKQLVSSNLRLVVHTARKHVYKGGDMLECISEGNLVLIRSVSKFDYTRGNKFSTYATWALIKRFATLKSTQARQMEFGTADEALEVAQDLRVPVSQLGARESARQSLEQVIADMLEEREQLVVREHYGLLEPAEPAGQRHPRSLAQIAELIGISKERVRQIELYALKKLRKALSVDQFELLTQM